MYQIWYGDTMVNYQVLESETWRTGAILNFNKKDGYRQRNVRQFMYILASPGTIAVNVT